jgi:hypothetical protein
VGVPAEEGHCPAIAGTIPTIAANDLHGDLEHGAETAGVGDLEDGKETPGDGETEKRAERVGDGGDLGTADEADMGDGTLAFLVLAHRDRKQRTRWPSP